MSDDIDNGAIGPIWTAVRELGQAVYDDMGWLRQRIESWESRLNDLAGAFDGRISTLELRIGSLLEGSIAATQAQGNELARRVADVADRLAKFEGAQVGSTVSSVVDYPSQAAGAQNLAHPEIRQPLTDELLHEMGYGDPDDHERTRDAEMKRLREERDRLLQEKRDMYSELVRYKAADKLSRERADNLQRLLAQGGPPLRWTTTAPTEPGWYWVMWPYEVVAEAEVVRVDDGGEWERGQRWAGPIQMPEEG